MGPVATSGALAMLQVAKSGIDGTLQLLYTHCGGFGNTNGFVAPFYAVAGAVVRADMRETLGTRSQERSRKFWIPAQTNTLYVRGASWAGGIATLTVGSHQWQVGAAITVAGMTPNGFNGSGLSVTAVTITTISYALASNPGAYTSGGTLTGYSWPPNDEMLEDDQIQDNFSDVYTVRDWKNPDGERSIYKFNGVCTDTKQSGQVGQ